MPRKPRIYLKTNFFHVINQGVNREYIFNNDINKKQYIKLLFDNKDKYDIDIISFAIMDNHFHLLIYAEKIEELSQYMKKVNGVYALMYNKTNNRVGPVFRERFKSQPIYDERYLFQCILYIHRNPIKAGITFNLDEYEFASTTQYSLKKVTKILNKNIIIMEENEKQDFLEVEKEMTEEEVKNIINKIIVQTKKDMHITSIDKKDKKVTIKLVDEIRKNTGITMERIAKYLGISKSMVYRCIKLAEKNEGINKKS